MKPVLESYYNRIQIFIWKNCKGLKSIVRLEQRGLWKSSNVFKRNSVLQ